MTATPPVTYDAQYFASLTEAPTTPFELTCSQGSLLCTDVLRFLPGKRLVLKAVSNDRTVIAKCFFGSNAERDKDREVQGIQGFQKAGVYTPDLIGTCSDNTFSLVLTAALEPVESFDQVWQHNLSEAERKQWLTNISNTLATLHKAGVQQTDIHLDNLLLHKGQLFLIDGGGAKVQDTPLDSQTALKNLALFQAVLYPKYDKFITDIWSAYSDTVPEYTAQSTHQEFSQQVQQLRKWREKFIQKALRNCTQFRVEKSWRHFQSVDKHLDSDALQKVLKNPEQAIASSNILKKGRTNTVAIVTMDNGEKVLVKRYKSTKGILHKYLRCLRQSRARKSWLNSQLLDMLGIPTPKAYAMLECRFGPLVTCSYTFHSYQPSLHALEWFAQTPLPENHLEVADKIGEILVSLQRALVYHGDLKATNILIDNGIPVLIDLDAMTSYKKPSKFRRANHQDIKRFARNWADLPKVANVFSPIIKKLNKDRDTL